MGERAELEGRYVKRFGVRRFVAVLNMSESLPGMVAAALKDRIQALLAATPPDHVYSIHIDNEDAELSVITASGGKGLHRGLYQQSKFFKWIPTVSVSRTGGLVLHEMLDATGATQPRAPADLDPFNQYVLLHFIPYLYAVVTSGESEEDAASREAAQEVITDKLSLLIDNSD